MVRQAAAGGGDQLCLQPSSSWSARFPDPPRSPPTTTHLPGKVRVRARLWKRLVVKSGCVGCDSGNIWLDKTRSPIWKFPPGPLMERTGARQSRLDCFLETGLLTLEFESQPCQPFEAQRNCASSLHLLLQIVLSAMVRTFKNKIYFTASSRKCAE